MLIMRTKSSVARRTMGDIGEDEPLLMLFFGAIKTHCFGEGMLIITTRLITTYIFSKIL